jgi:antitoxin HicB
MQIMNTHIGNDFDDFLREEGILAVEAAALKRVLAFQIQQEMVRHNLTKTAMAGKMKTSRASIIAYLIPPTAQSPCRHSSELHWRWAKS